MQVLKFNMREENVMIPSSLEGRLVESEPMAGFQRKLGVGAGGWRMLSGKCWGRSINWMLMMMQDMM